MSESSGATPLALTSFRAGVARGRWYELSRIPHRFMRPPFLLLCAALAAVLLPLPAQAVRPWHPMVTKHPVGLSEATPLRGVALKKTRLTETKHNGPLLNT